MKPRKKEAEPNTRASRRPTARKSSGPVKKSIEEKASGVASRTGVLTRSVGKLEVPAGKQPTPGRFWQRIVTNQLDTVLVVLRPSRVAGMLNVSPAQVTRWRQGQVPDPGTRDRLRRLADTVGLLLQRYPPTVAADWLNAPNIQARDGGGTPAGLIREGRWDVLRAYAEEAVAEAYG